MSRVGRATSLENLYIWSAPEMVRVNVIHSFACALSLSNSCLAIAGVSGR